MPSSSPKLTASLNWLAELSLWRSTAFVSALSENTTWSAGDYNHSVYMVKNDLVTHYETAGTPYYTVAGDQAAQNGNIEVNSSTAFTDAQAIDWWMGAPFHAMAMMDPRLKQTGFGSYREVKSGWQAGFTLDTLRGNSFTGGAFPVYWPGNGVTEPLTRYSGNEFPDPLQACAGYSTPVGLPVFIEVGGNVKTVAGPVHTFTGNGTALEHCVIDGTNSALASYLYPRGGVIVIPRQPLQTGVTYTVSLTVNNIPYQWSFTVGPFSTASPTPWHTLNGVLTSRPAASSWGTSSIDVFARGSDNALYQTTWNGATWSSWTSLGGGLTSGPAAVSWGPNRIDVFVRGTDNQLWHKFWAGAWSGWEPLGGVLSSGPVVASWGAGRLDVFARGSDNQLWHKFWAGGWSAWEPLGGGLAADPGAVSWGPNRIDVFVRGTDNGLWHKWWDGSAWRGWEARGGVLSSGPAASSCTAGQLDVFATGPASALYQTGYDGGWSGWQSLGGQWTSDPGAICPAGSALVDLFERGTDNALWTSSTLAS